jgi:PAS domain S-box-containing protein
MPAYEEDLAFVQAAGFGELARAAMAAVLPELRARGARRVIRLLSRPPMPEVREKVLRAIMQGIGEGVLIWTIPEGVLSDCNEAAARILGVSRAELSGRTLDYPWLLEREDGSPLPPSARGAALAVRTGQSQPTMMVRVGRPDGSWAWVRSSSLVLRDSAGTAYAVVTTFVDVSELREAQEQVKRIASRLSEAMAGANVGTWELELATRLATRNARWAEILGHTSDEIEPTLAAFTERIHPDDREACAAAMAGGFRKAQPFVFECRARHKDGHWHWVQVRGSVVERGVDGQASRAAGVLVDVDARRRVEESLRLALADNERLVRELHYALDNVRTLEGLLPICMYCKAIRDENSTWSSLEAYVTKRTEAVFSHGICPACQLRHYGDDV